MTKIQTMQLNNNEEDHRYVFCGVGSVYRYKCPEITRKTPVVESNDVDVSLNLDGESGPFLKLLFYFASNEMLERSKNELRQNISMLKGRKINLQGYTDNIGLIETNSSLAISRAEKIKSILIENGCSGDQISTEGHPLCCYENTNNNEEERQKNRRVEVYLSH